MTKKPIIECRRPGCFDAPFLGGLCKKHHALQAAKEERHEAAVELLHKSILDDQVLQSPELRAELSRLQGYWRNACDVLIYKRDIPTMPAEEAEYASDWCISLAEEIVDAERAFRSGARPSGGLDSCRHWVWERFENLDKGLMSNGIPRPPKK